MGCSASVASRPRDLQAASPSARPAELETRSQTSASGRSSAPPGQSQSGEQTPRPQTLPTSGSIAGPRKPSQSGSASLPSSNTNPHGAAQLAPSRRSGELNPGSSRPSSAASSTRPGTPGSAPRVSASAPRNLSSEDESDDDFGRGAGGGGRHGPGLGTGSRSRSVSVAGSVSGSGRPSSAGGAPLAAALSDSARSSAQAPQPTVKISSKVVRDDDPLATVSKGITLRGLRALRHRLLQAFGDDVYPSLSTAEVNTAFVQRVTSPANCRLAELGDVVAPADLGPPHYLVSHAWRNNFDQLLRTVEAFLEPASETTRVWLDVIAVNQHAGPYQRADVAAFKDVVRAAAGGTLVVTGGGAAATADGADGCSPATRTWCLYEWAATLQTHGSDGLHLQMADAERAELVRGLDLARAECTCPADKEAILADVVREYGSVAAFNERMRLALMLRPLSYGGDVRWLAARSAGTAWEWGPVRQWLRAGGGSGGGGTRALCILAGPGEGKSTVAAALCGGGGGGGSEAAAGTGKREPGGAVEGPPLVTAHHFVKFSDQRRLDLARVVASLAFQLADRLPAFRNHLLTAPDVDAALAAAADPALAFELLLRKPLEATLGNTAGPGPANGPAFASANGAMVKSGSQRASSPASPHKAQGPLAGDLVILVDALDEADPGAGAGFEADGSGQARRQDAGHGAAAAASAGGAAGVPVCGNGVFQLLARQLRTLPPCVRFILTARPTGLSGGVRAALDRAFGEPAGGGSGGGGVTYLTPQQLRRSLAAASGSGVAAASNGGANAGAGVLLYHTVVDGCLRGSQPAATVAAAAAAGAGALPPLSGPPQLSELYDVYCRVFAIGFAARLADPRAAAAARRLLRVLLAAQEPLPLPLLHSLGFGSEAIEALPGYPVTFFADEHRAHLLHKSLADWLTDPRVSGSFHVRPLKGHRRIARRLLASLPGHHHRPGPPPAANGGTASAHAHQEAAGVSSPYALKYLVRHLVACRDTAALEGLLSNYTYLAAVFSQGHGRGLIRDLSALRPPDVTPALADGIRWLLASRHELYGSCHSAADVLGCAMRCPPASLTFRAAQEHGLAASPGNRTRWRLRHEMGAPSDWPVVRATLQGHSRPAAALSWSADGRTLATAGEDGSVRLWEAASGECLAVLQGHTEAVGCVVWSPDGRTLASGGKDGSVRLWDAVSGECSGRLLGTQSKSPKSAVSVLAWSPDGRLLLACDQERATFWDVVTGQPAADVPAPADAPGSVRAAAWCPDGRHLALCYRAEREVRLYNMRSGKSLARLTGHTDAVHCLAWSTDGRRLASGGGDGGVRLWGWATTPGGQEPQSMRQGPHLANGCGGSNGPVQSVSWSPDGSRVALCRGARGLELWDGGKGVCTAALEDPGANTKLLAVAWSPDGASLASAGGDDGAVRLWDASRLEPESRRQQQQKDQQVSSQASHSDAVGCVAWSPDLAAGGLLASCGHDGSVRLWEAAGGKCAALIQGHEGIVRRVEWSPDGSQLASGGCDGTVRVWSAGAGKLTAILRDHTARVWGVAWGPPGEGAPDLASGGEDRTVRLWRLVAASNPFTGGKCTGVLKGHTGHVLAVAWAHGSAGHLLASAGRDPVVRLWDTRSRNSIAGLQGHARDVTGVAWAPAGETARLATCSEDSTVRIWDAQAGQCTAVLKGHAKSVQGVAWSPDGAALATASTDCTVRVWDVRSGDCTAVLQGHSDAVNSVHWSPDGRALASGSSDKSIRVYDAL